MTSGEVIREARPPAIQQIKDCAGSLLIYPATVWRNREIVRNFYARELRSRFRGTVLGFAWPFVLPLVLFLVYYFVFAELLGAKFGMKGLGDAAAKSWFTVYLFVGVIVWSGFAESVTRNATVILENANLIKKIAFPSEIMPLNTIFVSLTIQAIAIGAYLGLAPLMGWNPWTPHLAALPILFIMQAALAAGPSLAVAASNVFVRDTAPILGIAMTFWQFVTPVFWSTSVLDPATIDKYRYALELNPMYHLLEGYRKVLVNAGVPGESGVAAAWPWEECRIVALSSIVLFAFGFALFFASKRKFADEL